MIIVRLLSVTCLLIAVAGCARTQVLPLAPNAVQINTHGRGLIAQNQVVPQTMRTAAAATLRAGYTHFKFADASLRQGEVVTGAIGNASGTYGGGSYSGWGSSTVIRAPTASASVTVIMFKEKDAGAKGAFNARDVLKQYPQ